MPGALRLATVLLPNGAPLRPYRTTDGMHGGVVDLSYLEFVIEALIAQSAVNIALSPDSQFYDDHHFLPSSLKARIRKIDTRGEAREKAHAALQPVISEVGVTVHGSGSVFEMPVDANIRLATTVAEVLGDLRTLLVGITYRCQLPLDRRRMQSAIATLQRSVSKPESRAVLALIEGLLALYEPTDVPSLQRRPDIESAHVRAFSQFVTDETYRSMSRQAGLLGVPAKATLAILSMRRKLAELLERPRVADLYEAGTVPVEMATQMPPLRAPLLERLLSPDADYLPPLVDLSAATTRAETDWVTAAPPLRVPRNLQRQFQQQGRIIVAEPDVSDFWQFPAPPADLFLGEETKG